MLNYGDLASFFLWLHTLPTGRLRTVFSPARWPVCIGGIPDQSQRTRAHKSPSCPTLNAIVGPLMPFIGFVQLPGAFHGAIAASALHASDRVGRLRPAVRTARDQRFARNR